MSQPTKEHRGGALLTYTFQCMKIPPAKHTYSALFLRDVYRARGIAMPDSEYGREGRIRGPQSSRNFISVAVDFSVRPE